MKPGENKSLADTHPQLAKQWHSDNSLSPAEASAGSHKKILWQCSEKHIWEARIVNRVNGTGCPVCSNRVIIAGVNDLALTHPYLIEFWNNEKNEKRITEISPRSGKKVWWIFSCGHERFISPDKAVKASSFRCLYCTTKTRKTLAGVNDLITTHPHLAAEWDYTQNEKTPEQVVSGSHLQAWWLCTNHNHSWKTSVKHRAISGSNCPYCAGQKVLPGFNDLITTHPAIAALWSSSNTTSPSEVNKGSSNKKYLWECSDGHVWSSLIPDIVRGNRCPECAKKKFISSAEQEIYLFFKSLGIEVEQQNRSIIGKEIDIYFPTHKIGIEFNGVYWHSDIFPQKDAQYRHHKKWSACQEKGIQLIQIWEDEYRKNPELIKRMLIHKLEITQEPKIFARTTTLDEVAKTEAEAFFNKNHIQGFSSGTHYLVLKNYAQEIVASIILKKEQNNILNIVRYATEKHVIGGFTKLLKYAERMYQPDKFITFADHCVSNGDLYESNGFVADKILPPDYMYVVKGERKHKFGYRLKRFKNDPNLQWVEGLTERELAALNNLPRIWDAGKTRYIKPIVM